MNYLKQHHLSLLIVLWLVVSPLWPVVSPFLFGGDAKLSGSDLTTIGNPTTFTDTVTLSGPVAISGAVTSTGTTTVAQSVDGIVIGGTISTAATGTVRTVYTNTTGPKMCDASTAYLYVKNNGSFAPSLVFSVGTSTTASASTNLVASSTVATSTSSFINPAASTFLLGANDVLTAIIGDISNTEASSTYLGNWSAEVGIWCQDISI